VAAFLWPDTYISQALMRITPQQVPENLIPSVLNTQMAERLNQLQQEILSRTSLQELIQRPRWTCTRESGSACRWKTSSRHAQ